MFSQTIPHSKSELFKPYLFILIFICFKDPNWLFFSHFTKFLFDSYANSQVYARRKSSSLHYKAPSSELWVYFNIWNSLFCFLSRSDFEFGSVRELNILCFFSSLSTHSMVVESFEYNLIAIAFCLILNVAWRLFDSIFCFSYVLLPWD